MLYPNERKMLYTMNALIASIKVLNQNQIFYYTRCITPKRVASLRVIAPAQQLFSRKCRSDGETLAILSIFNRSVI